MTERRPLILDAGTARELPIGDSLAGASSGAPTLVPDGATYTVADYTQVPFRKRPRLGEGSRIALGESSIFVGI